MHKALAVASLRRGVGLALAMLRVAWQTSRQVRRWRQSRFRGDTAGTAGKTDTGWAHRARTGNVDATKARLREQLFEAGVSQHRSNLLVELSQRETKDTEVLAIVGHLLYEGLIFHHKHFTVALSALGKRGLWRAACSLFDEMRTRGLEPNSISYNAVIHGCRRGRAWNQAVGLLGEMRAVSAKMDVISFGAAIAACKECSKWERALFLFGEQREISLQPDQQSFAAVISACAKGRQWVLSLNFLKNMREELLEPDLVCHNSAINACSGGATWPCALELLRGLQVQGPSPDDFSYNSAAAACEAGAHWQEALDVLMDMMQRGIPPSIVTYNTAIKACWHAGDRWEEAVSMLQELRQVSLSPSNMTYSALFLAFAPQLRWQEGLLVLLDMQKQGLAPNFVTYMVAVTLLSRSGQYARALRLYLQASAVGILSPWARTAERGVLDLRGQATEVALIAVFAVLTDALRQPSNRYCHDLSSDLVIKTGREGGLDNDPQSSLGGWSKLVQALAAFLSDEFDPPLELRPTNGGDNPVGKSHGVGRWTVPSEALLRWAHAAERKEPVSREVDLISKRELTVHPE